MQHRTITRFYLVTGVVVLGEVTLLMLHSTPGCILLAVVYALAVALGVTFPQLAFFGPFICFGNSKKRCVALTFDDGPDAGSTPALLDLLNERGVKAAFFCVGERVEANRELTARLAREGHLVENHSFAHSNFTNLFSVAKLRSEMTRTQNAIQQAAGVVPKLFRPPMGLSNPHIFWAASQVGLRVIGWTARGLDTQTKSPDLIVGRIIKRLQPGAIILLHDGNIPPERLLPTVKMLLNELRSLDYQVVRLDELV